nr:cytochrome P450 CYP82D47-like [Ipomoea batatas]
MDSSLISIVAAAFLLLPLLYKLFCNKDVSRKPPEAGGAWPIIGHLHLLAAPEATFKILRDMAKKYGPIFQIRLGPNPVLVVSDSRVAKECFTTNDKALASRPKSLSIEIMGYNYANFGFAPYGPYWRHVRKVVMLELLSKRRLEMLGRVRESGVKSFMGNIYGSWKRDKIGSSEDDVVMLDMKEWFPKLVMDIMIRMLFGLGYHDGGSQASETISRFFELMDVTPVGEFVPWLRWLDIGGHEKAIRETAKDMDGVMEAWLQEHKRKRSSKPKEEEDFMDALLSHFDADNDIPKDFDPDTIVKATCMAVLGAATDTTALTLTWALSLILNNPSTLEKIRGELDIHVGKERQVEESDINNLIYLQALVKETLRLYPPGPLLLPHECIEDCTVDGYHVTKGTRLLVNVSMIHRDPEFWSDPDAFRPERFLEEHKEVDVRGNHFNLIPFGGGRRICPGISLGLQSVQLALANLVHGFDVKKISEKPIDMTEAPGLSNVKATPLNVFLSPRLPSHLYG